MAEVLFALGLPIQFAACLFSQKEFAMYSTTCLGVIVGVAFVAAVVVVVWMGLKRSAETYDVKARAHGWALFLDQLRQQVQRRPTWRDARCFLADLYRDGRGPAAQGFPAGKIKAWDFPDTSWDEWKRRVQDAEDTFVAFSGVGPETVTIEEVRDGMPSFGATAFLVRRGETPKKAALVCSDHSCYFILKVAAMASFPASVLTAADSEHVLADVTEWDVTGRSLRIELASDSGIDYSRSALVMRVSAL
jgi:hypothetical protein